jgi:HD-GYP domain-containing protein (c-di-GMP phosphodiesterase class II)
MKKEIKISINGLQLGMYVSRLDRPWLQTRFSLQGFEIRDPKDIERMRTYCSYVYVDIEKGPAPDPQYWILAGDPSPEPPDRKHGGAKRIGKKSDKDEFAKLRKTTYKKTSGFASEVKVVEKVSKKLRGSFDRFVDDLKRSRKLDLNVVKEGVAAMVDSIIRNPSAMMWVQQVKKLDEYTYSRALGTSVWCATFGRHLGMEKDVIKQLALGGLLLDIGKSLIPVSLLNKTDSLDENEIELLHTHVDLGIRLLTGKKYTAGAQKLPVPVMQMIATHHERANGSGYPQGLDNDQIPMLGRIAGIVDTYDALTSKHPYNPQRLQNSPHEGVEKLYGMRDRDFQAELVEQFIQTVGLYPTGSLIELSTGEVGVVVATNGLRRLRPTVMLLLDDRKDPIPEFRHLDLSKVKNGSTVARGLPAGAYGIDMKELFL